MKQKFVAEIFENSFYIVGRYKWARPLALRDLIPNVLLWQWHK